MSVAQWALDASHSQVGFSVRHMMISNVRGSFGEFTANVSADPAQLASTAQIEVEINTSSVDTKDAQRDGHLRSDDFFQSEKHPTMQFKGTSLTQVSDDEYKLEGTLTIIGHTQPVTLTCEISGPAKDPWGNERIGVVANGTISRKDFGLTWNSVLEAGGVMVGDAVKLAIEMEFVKQA